MDFFTMAYLDFLKDLKFLFIFVFVWLFFNLFFGENKIEKKERKEKEKQIKKEEEIKKIAMYKAIYKKSRYKNKIIYWPVYLDFSKKEVIWKIISEKQEGNSFLSHSPHLFNIQTPKGEIFSIKWEKAKFLYPNL